MKATSFAIGVAAGALLGAAASVAAETYMPASVRRDLRRYTHKGMRVHAFPLFHCLSPCFFVRPATSILGGFGSAAGPALAPLPHTQYNKWQSSPAA